MPLALGLKTAELEGPVTSGTARGLCRRNLRRRASEGTGDGAGRRFL